MMGKTATLWLFLLLSQLSFCPTDADQELSTMQTHTSHSENRLGSTTLAEEPSLTTSDYNNSSDLIRADCLMDTELGLIALGSAGGLIVCLLVTTVVLACQVCQLQRRARMPRSSRSNLDLVSSTGYWGGDRAEVQGLVGPCDASVMLEEVRADGKTEEEADIREAVQEAGGRHQEEATAGDGDPEEKVALMQGSGSRDSCLEVPSNLEDMPLVV